MLLLHFISFPNLIGVSWVFWITTHRTHISELHLTMIEVIFIGSFIWILDNLHLALVETISIWRFIWILSDLYLSIVKVIYMWRLIRIRSDLHLSMVKIVFSCKFIWIMMRLLPVWRIKLKLLIFVWHNLSDLITSLLNLICMHLFRCSRRKELILCLIMDYRLFCTRISLGWDICLIFYLIFLCNFIWWENFPICRWRIDLLFIYKVSVIWIIIS